jgi:signal transduction histidine kinase
MSEQQTPQPSRKPSAAGRAVSAFFIALIITGAGLAWALVTVSKAAFAQVAADGGAAVVAMSAVVAVAVFFAQAASTANRRAAALDLEVHAQQREFAELAQETLPLIARRVRDGLAADDIFVSIPRPESAGVRALLTTLQLALSSLLDDTSSAQRAAAAAITERADLEAQSARLARETLPLVIAKLRSGDPKDLALADLARPESPELNRLLDAAVTQIAAAERRASSAMAACASAAARIQAQSTRMLAELRDMEVRYGDDKVFGDLMELDHRVSQTGRLADSIALLAGGRSGRRWTKPIAMESILRGAMGRIDAYQRVRLHSTSTAALAGYAAEGVMHALAELMDNAAAFSAHGSEVHVFVEEEDAGVVVTVDDSGLGMRRRERDRAEELVSQALDLATLPGTRLGLAVVGRVASRYGLSVNFRPSSRGGTGVVVLLPRRLITHPREEIGAISARPATPSWSPATPAAPAVSRAQAREAIEMTSAETQPGRTRFAGTQFAGTQAPETQAAETQAAETQPGGGVFHGTAFGGTGFSQEEPGETGADDDMGDLPVRPRGRTLARSMRPAQDTPGQGMPAPGVPAGQEAPEQRPARGAGARFAAFRQAGARARGGSQSAPSVSGEPGAGSGEDGSKGSA